MIGNHVRLDKRVEKASGVGPEDASRGFVRSFWRSVGLLWGAVLLRLDGAYRQPLRAPPPSTLLRIRLDWEGAQHAEALRKMEPVTT
jgi:hypothetical protein